MKKLIVCIATMFVMLMVAPLSVSGQQTARKFIVPKSTSSVNLRQSPNSSAKVVGQLNPDFSLPVVSKSSDGKWYQVVNTDGQKAWISISVCRESEEVLDIESIKDVEFGVSVDYEEWYGWCVAPVKGTDWYVAYTACDNTQKVPWPWGSQLWLGKKEGEHLVFDRYVVIETHCDETYQKLSIKKMQNENGIFYAVYYSEKNATPMWWPHPSIFEYGIVNQLFKGSEHKGRFLYLGPELFTQKYRDVEFG